MLVFDLICSQGHSFEGWFSDLQELEAQIRDGLLQCPLCDDAAVSRRPSTFGVVKSARPEIPAAPSSPEQLMEHFIQRWEDFSQKLDKEFDDVGSNFADEALKMHYGVSAPRNIRGQSTEEQDTLLKNEGVAVYKLPVIHRKNRVTSGSN